MFETDHALLEIHSKLFLAQAKRLGFALLLLAFVFITVSCGAIAQAAGTQNLGLYGSLPQGTVNQSYNAVLTVVGGSSPYSFSLKSGELPPGINLNNTTGGFYGKPSTPGTFSFEVIVSDASLHEQGSRSFAVSIAGGGGGSVKVSVSPTSGTLLSKQTQQFTASVSGTSDTAVTWSATTGSVSGSGLYTAPTVTKQTDVVVTATSIADPSKSASASITVDSPNQQPLQITTSGTLPQGQQGNTYNDTFTASGGTMPYSWSVSAGTPPPGVALNSNGNFAGMPTTTGTFSFMVVVTDATSKTASGTFSVNVAGGSGYDGPAQLPIATVQSAIGDTPAPGSVIKVAAGGNLQSALNNAQCGDVIQLQAGATFSGQFTVPAKNCDINHWIWVRTSSPDSALPAEGQRATPCYAGVASLEGRPQYTCPETQNVMAKVQITTQGDGPFQFAAGANFYRFIGLQVTRPAGTPGVAQLFSIHKGATADHIVIDRSWLHGATQDETNTGVNVNGMTNVAIVDSYFSDFHCISKTGQCIDSHAVLGGLGDTQDGPFLIQDNFLEASGEAVIFGGGAATTTPTDITITGNHFWKPWQWMKGNNPYVGGTNGNPFVVKNHLELKNAVRVLVEANLMENSWGGFSQTGYGILLTPKNQHRPDGSNVCPLCQVTDVTIRYVHVSHAGGGIQMATSISGDGGGGAAALAGARWSIHDVVLDDLSTKYVGPGTAFELTNTWPTNPLNTVTINHVTGFPDPSSHLIVMGNQVATAPMYGLIFTNNLNLTGQYPIWNSGGGQANCAVLDVPISSIAKCFATYTFGNNGLIASPSKFPPSSWPSNNMFPQTVDDVQFVNFNNGNGGNYELQSGSPYKNKGTDSKDLGADIAGLNEMLANVQ
jgi:hypothetical protein